MNAIHEWIEHHLPHKESTELWDLTAALLTELSERDSVQYRVRATDKSVVHKLSELDIEPCVDEITHDSEGC